MKNTVVWDAAPCGCCENVFSDERVTSIIGVKNQRARNNVSSNWQLLIAVNVPSSLILFALMMEAIHFS
jgi:hypothetical protein